MREVHVRPQLPHVRGVVHHPSSASTVIVVPVPSGHPDRYDVLRLPDYGGPTVTIGCELPLALALRVAGRAQTEDGQPLSGGER
jgi:hypothetical protein